jgi:Zn-dependent peptidase ImmA (M78 family)
MVAVSPGVLEWARNYRRLTLPRAATKLEWPEEKLQEIEGASEVDNDDLEKLASAYRLSPATLWMPAPLPADRYPPREIQDFRTHAHVASEPLTMGTQLRIENAFELIELLSEVNDADDEVAPRPLLPTRDLGDDPQRVAARERGRIGPQLESQLGWTKDKEAFLHWREMLEAQEIIVQKAPLHEQSVRGFALFKSGYGFIAVDSTDDYRVRNFTLLHEYAHLLIHQSGISDQNRQTRIERWCNQFAANFLMPADGFIEQYRLRFSPQNPPSDSQVSTMAKLFHVSKSATAIRFEELQLATAGFYDRLKAEWGKLTPHQQRGNTEHDQIDIELGRLGTTHVSAINEALERGIIDRLEARYALDVPLEHLPQLIVAARTRHQAYGPPR